MDKIVPESPLALTDTHLRIETGAEEDFMINEDVREFCVPITEQDRKSLDEDGLLFMAKSTRPSTAWVEDRAEQSMQEAGQFCCNDPCHCKFLLCTCFLLCLLPDEVITKMQSLLQQTNPAKANLQGQAYRAKNYFLLVDGPDRIETAKTLHQSHVLYPGVVDDGDCSSDVVRKSTSEAEAEMATLQARPKMRCSCSVLISVCTDILPNISQLYSFDTCSELKALKPPTQSLVLQGVLLLRLSHAL